MNIEDKIRKLARSNYWQEIYNFSKECSGIHLFDNVSNFSGLQYLTMYWLKVYNLLYNEYAQLEWENLDEEVIKDNDRCDAFLYWRSKEIKKQLKEYKKESKKQEKKGRMKVYQGNKDEGSNK